MTTKSCLPPPPPPPPSSGTKPPRGSSPPRPQYAAMPFTCDSSPPVQETGDQGDNSHHFQCSTPAHRQQHTSTSTSTWRGGHRDRRGGRSNTQSRKLTPPPQAYENPQPSETPNPEGNVNMMDEDNDIQDSRSA